jgi:hypothetical protein
MKTQHNNFAPMVDSYDGTPQQAFVKTAAAAKARDPKDRLNHTPVMLTRTPQTSQSTKKPPMRHKAGRPIAQSDTRITSQMQEAMPLPMTAAQSKRAYNQSPSLQQNVERRLMTSNTMVGDIRHKPPTAHMHISEQRVHEYANSHALSATRIRQSALASSVEVLE